MIVNLAMAHGRLVHLCVRGKNGVSYMYTLPRLPDSQAGLKLTEVDCTV